MIDVAMMLAALAVGAPSAYRLSIDIVDANGAEAHPVLVAEAGQTAAVRQAGDPQYSLTARVTRGDDAKTVDVALQVTAGAGAPRQEFRVVVGVGHAAEMRYASPMPIRRIVVRVDPAGSPAARP